MGVSSFAHFTHHNQRPKYRLSAIISDLFQVLKAQEEAKPFLYCTLISSAATHCQRMGYHREATYRKMKADEASNARSLCWTTYAFDNNISFLIGRASRIRDFEIDAVHPTVSKDLGLRPWDESFILGIKLASIQGQIYTNLYSAAGLKKSVSERSEEIARLSAALGRWRTELKQVSLLQHTYYGLIYACLY